MLPHPHQFLIQTKINLHCYLNLNFIPSHYFL